MYEFLKDLRMNAWLRIKNVVNDFSKYYEFCQWHVLSFHWLHKKMGVILSFLEVN